MIIYVCRLRLSTYTIACAVGYTVYPVQYPWRLRRYDPPFSTPASEIVCDLNRTVHACTAFIECYGETHWPSQVGDTRQPNLVADPEPLHERCKLRPIVCAALGSSITAAHCKSRTARASCSTCRPPPFPTSTWACPAGTSPGCDPARSARPQRWRTHR